jgi:hypothetical protein
MVGTARPPHPRLPKGPGGLPAQPVRAAAADAVGQPRAAAARGAPVHTGGGGGGKRRLSWVCEGEDAGQDPACCRSLHAAAPPIRPPADGPLPRRPPRAAMGRRAGGPPDRPQRVAGAVAGGDAADARRQPAAAAAARRAAGGPVRRAALQPAVCADDHSQPAGQPARGRRQDAGGGPGVPCCARAGAPGRSSRRGAAAAVPARLLLLPCCDPAAVPSPHRHPTVTRPSPCQIEFRQVIDGVTYDATAASLASLSGGKLPASVPLAIPEVAVLTQQQLSELAGCLLSGGPLPWPRPGFQLSLKTHLALAGHSRLFGTPAAAAAAAAAAAGNGAGGSGGAAAAAAAAREAEERRRVEAAVGAQRPRLEGRNADKVRGKQARRAAPAPRPERVRPLQPGAASTSGTLPPIPLRAPIHAPTHPPTHPPPAGVPAPRLPRHRADPRLRAAPRRHQKAHHGRRQP